MATPVSALEYNTLECHTHVPGAPPAGLPVRPAVLLLEEAVEVRRKAEGGEGGVAAVDHRRRPGVVLLA